MDERALVEAMIGTAGAGRGVTNGEESPGAAPVAVRRDDKPQGAPPDTHDGPTPSGAHHRFTASPTGGAPAPAAPRAATRATAPPPVVLRLRDASFVDRIGVTRLRAVTLDIRAGEIVGVAGVEGAGQHELLRLLAGRLAPTSGEAALPATIGFVPEDRHRDALALTQALVDNVVLRGAGRRRGRIRWSAEHARTAELLTAYDVRGGTTRTPAGALSGGNQQKLVLAREIADDPPALVVESPTRGLDVRAGAAVLDRLRAARERGMAVVVYSSDLDELLLLADRVLVAHGGRLREVPRRARRSGERSSARTEQATRRMAAPRAMGASSRSVRATAPVRSPTRDQRPATADLEFRASRRMLQIPSAGPSASIGNAHAHPTRATSGGTSWMTHRREQEAERRLHA